MIEILIVLAVLGIVIDEFAHYANEIAELFKDENKE